MNVGSIGNRTAQLRDRARAVGSRGLVVALPEEHLTADLLEQLLAAESPDAYLDAGETIDRELVDYLRDLLADRHMNRSQLSRASGVTMTYVYQIFDGERTPRRDTAIMLALGLRCSVIEAQRLLRLAGVSELWPKRRRDAIILWCIERGMDCASCDDELARFDETTLFKPDRQGA